MLPYQRKSMKNIPSDLFKKIVRLSEDVKRDLKNQGIVVPTENNDGSISVGAYKIIKNSNGYYSVVDHKNDELVGDINLPQTAVIVANNLALGKFKDLKVIETDKHYGYALFDELLHKKAVEKSSKKSLEYFDLMLTKCLIARAKKENYKKDLILSYKKLIKLA